MPLLIGSSSYFAKIICENFVNFAYLRDYYILDVSYDYYICCAISVVELRIYSTLNY